MDIMKTTKSIIHRYNPAQRRFLRGALIGMMFVVMAAAAASAATVVLTNGATIKGKLISRSNNDITIKEEATGQLRAIRNDQVRDLILDQAEKAEEDKRAKKGGVDLKLRGDAGLDLMKDGRRHILLALGGSGGKIIDGPGNALNFGFGGTFIFQYNYIVKGFGVDLHAAYYYNMDKIYPSDHITILPVLVSPMYKFNTKYIDIDLRAGAGISWTYGKSALRYRFIPTGDPGQPLAAIKLNALNASSIDLAVGAGVGISHTFSNGIVLGFEANYYYIFQTLSANAVGASIYCGYAF
jgi:hypothetical protein